MRSLMNLAGFHMLDHRLHLPEIGAIRVGRIVYVFTLNEKMLRANYLNIRRGIVQANNTISPVVVLGCTGLIADDQHFKVLRNSIRR
jgi:hypothetical protein